jgi:hypothetical protein
MAASLSCTLRSRLSPLPKAFCFAFSVGMAFALSLSSSHAIDDAARAAIDKARGIDRSATPDPFISTAQTQNEVNCVSALELLMEKDGVSSARTVTLLASTDALTYRFTLDETSAQRLNCRVADTLILPAETDIALQLTSEDTIHELKVPELSISAFAVPGRIEMLQIAPQPKREAKAELISSAEGGETARAVSLQFLPPADVRPALLKQLETGVCVRE